MPSNTYLSRNKDKFIVDYLSGNFSLKELAERYQTTDASVNMMIYRNGLAKRKRKIQGKIDANEKKAIKLAEKQQVEVAAQEMQQRFEELSHEHKNYMADKLGEAKDRLEVDAMSKRHLNIHLGNLKDIDLLARNLFGIGDQQRVTPTQIAIGTLVHVQNLPQAKAGEANDSAQVVDVPVETVS